MNETTNESEDGTGKGGELTTLGSTPVPAALSLASPAAKCVRFWYDFTDAVDNFWQAATNDMSVLSTFVFVMCTALVVAGHYEFATTFGIDYSGNLVQPLRHELNMPFHYFLIAYAVLALYTFGYMWFVWDRMSRLKELKDGQRMLACTKIVGSEKCFDGGLISCRAVIRWTTFLVCFSFVACGIEVISFNWCPGQPDAAIECLGMLPVSAVVFAILYGLYATAAQGDIRPPGHRRRGSGRFLLTLMMVVSLPLAGYYVLFASSAVGTLTSMIYVCIGFVPCFLARLLFKEGVTVDEDRGYKAD
jgi:hypothetical protein